MPDMPRPRVPARTDQGAAAERQGGGPRQRLTAGERLPQILDAAFEEFAERGYAGASMAATATRAGIAKGLIYHYFPGKAALFQAVVRSCLQPRFAEAEALVAAFAGRPRAALLQALIDQAYARIAEERRERIVLKLLLTEAGRFPELSGLYRTEVLGRALDLVRTLLRAGAEAGEFRPEAAAEGVAEVLLAPVAMAGIWQMMLGEAEAPAPAAMRQAHAALALHGLFPAATRG
jgi:AcrR family transcriptional regulator